MATYPGGFSSYVERDAWIRDHAEYFTVVRYLGPRVGYERYEVTTLPEAEELAAFLADKNKRPYMIYAVAGLYDAFLKSVGTVKPLIAKGKTSDGKNKRNRNKSDR